MKKFALLILVAAVTTVPLFAQPLKSAYNIKQLDPCKFGTPAQIKPFLQTGLNAAFPLEWSKPGKKLTIKDPELLSVTCNPLRTEIRAQLHYRDTRGLDQGSASGQVRWASNLMGYVKYSGPAPVTSANFVDANVCISDINVLGLNIHNVPNWLDNTWIRDILNEKLAGKQFCPNIKPLVAAWLAAGNTIP